MIVQQELGTEPDTRRFAEECRESGLRATPQRIEIYRELAGTDRHPDVEALFRAVRVRLPSISLDTVYRTLRLLEQKGMIRTVGLPSNRIRYDAVASPHPHFFCIRCGRIEDLDGDESAGPAVPSDAHRYGEVDDVRLLVRGTCHACLRRSADGARGKNDVLERGTTAA